MKTIMKTVAEIHYRSYVPYGWLASRFFYLNFSGDNGFSFYRKWSSIEEAEEKKRNKEIEDITKRINEQKEKIKRIETIAQNYKKPFWHFWKTEEEIRMAEDIDTEWNCLLDLKQEKEKVEEIKRNSSVIDDYYRAREFLNENHFHFISQALDSNDGCPGTIEIWEKEYFL